MEFATESVVPVLPEDRRLPSGSQRGIDFVHLFALCRDVLSALLTPFYGAAG